ncbi:class I SAM-dependent methyltransferase [Tessaracoccus sp. OH4464_COT-324]|uniref:class I SAM-dependent methyltransferase n=1 Tax=Tessaracoccus sp. OH4464_COT-324 TaxID=2491059 RepID=UPI000F63D6A7|nr:class I SAM-dependent methyltransferase [Tessaracoccus sp. OH4464_COT-324]RRD46572.1 class I SAM-dependent methyltransferase [Tessaracoccus sp. OH4464_COT-324]
MSEAHWDERYRAEGARYGTEPNTFLRDNAHFLRPNSRVLCVGDGEGRNGVHLAGLGHRVVSLDQSSVGLAKARELAASRGVELETWHVGLEHYVGFGEAPEPWDGIVFIFVHLAPELRAAVARELTRQCAPGAVLLWESFSPAQRQLSSGGPHDISRLTTRADLAETWADGWRLDVRIVERVLKEGYGHDGLAAVVQAIGLRN